MTSLGEISDISVSKTLELAEPHSGDDSITDLTYKIVVENLGPSDANSINVVDLLDSPKLDVGATASWIV